MKDLKRLYREASQRCHPDRVGEEDQTRAAEVFVRLQAAYRNNDLDAVRAIHCAVREGQLFVGHGMVLSDAESLRHAIVVLRHDLDHLASEIQALRASETYRTLKDLADWDAYFDEQRLTLDDAVLRLEDDRAARNFRAKLRLAQHCSDPRYRLTPNCLIAGSLLSKSVLFLKKKLKRLSKPPSECLIA
ncbi:J domain-containing protein [uncultured Thiodictyon sp.]|uniref:J domain-containing protein n=1 Tax=uncultured Thiodictyon sp. TaxID=1846217 RepID=UPI0025E3DD4E|nr:J domain-containing protein [uncultured Thiodictyon sp.]